MIPAILAGALWQSSGMAQNAQLQGTNPFQQLGQDLQSGNLSAAQSDFATLVQNSPLAQPSSTTTTSLSQAFTNLGQDLKSGNINAAQKDYSTIQQDLQQSSNQYRASHHHHHRIDFASSSSGAQNPIAQELGAVGQALQTGNLANAQQAYSTLQSSLQQFATSFAPSAGAQSSGSGYSFMA
jgi:hypothetical protein